MSRTSNVIRNIKFGLMNHVLTLLLQVINRTVFIKILGSEYLGINGLFSDVLMMLSLADLGLNTAMVYSFYKPLAENDNVKVTALVQFYKRVYNVIAVIVAIIGICLVPILPYIVNMESNIPHLEIYYVCFLANTVISYLFVYKTCILSADQKNYLISIYQTIVSLLRLLMQIILLLILKNYLVYLVCQVMATLVNNIIASKKVDELYPYINKKKVELEKDERHNLFQNIKSVFIYKVSSVLLNGTDNLLISVIVGTIWSGFYSNYNLVINAVNNFVNILYNSATASIGNLVVKSNTERRMEVFRMLQTVSLVITSFTTVCFCLLFSDLMYVWLGKDFVLDWPILVAICLNYYLGGVLHPIWSYREATGLYRQTKYIMLICAIENIILSVILGIFFGMAGILFASAISRLTTYFWYEPRILFKRYFNVSVKEYFIPLILNVCLTIGIIIVMEVLLEGILITGWLSLVVKSCITAIITLIIVCLFYWKTSGFKLLMEQMVKNRIF